MLVKDIGNNLEDILAPVDLANRMAFVKIYILAAVSIFHYLWCIVLYLQGWQQLGKLKRWTNKRIINFNFQDILSVILR